jgi:homoserine acetyltransferase
VGREISGFYGHLGSDGLSTQRKVQPELDDAAANHRQIRNDPDWKNGDYTSQPRSAEFASVFYGIAMAGGTLAYQKLAPTRETADKLLDERLAAPFPADANDTLYQWASSGDYDPSSELERIQSTVLAINSADDERNPPETGIMERELKRIRSRGPPLCHAAAGPKPSLRAS